MEVPAEIPKHDDKRVEERHPLTRRERAFLPRKAKLGRQYCETNSDSEEGRQSEENQDEKDKSQKRKQKVTNGLS